MWHCVKGKDNIEQILRNGLLTIHMCVWFSSNLYTSCAPYDIGVIHQSITQEITVPMDSACYIKHTDHPKSPVTASRNWLKINHQWELQCWDWEPRVGGRRSDSSGFREQMSACLGTWSPHAQQSEGTFPACIIPSTFSAIHCFMRNPEMKINSIIRCVHGKYN